MKPLVFLHCASPVVAKALTDYLAPDFRITENPKDPALKAIIFDAIPAAVIKKYHEEHPHAMLYILVSPSTKIPPFPFPVRVLERPVSLKVLKAHLAEPLSPSILTLGEFKLYLNNRRLVHPDATKNCILTEKETEILAYLYKAHPAAVSRDMLLKDVWKYTEGVTTHTLETHLYKLKQKIGLASGENLLKTTDEGYSLNV